MDTPKIDPIKQKLLQMHLHEIERRMDDRLEAHLATIEARYGETLRSIDDLLRGIARDLDSLMGGERPQMGAEIEELTRWVQEIDQRLRALERR